MTDDDIESLLEAIRNDEAKIARLTYALQRIRSIDARRQWLREQGPSYYNISSYEPKSLPTKRQSFMQLTHQPDDRTRNSGGLNMTIVRKSAMTLVKAGSGNPVTTTVCVMLFYVMLNVCMANVEVLLFGKRFEHWGDVVAQVCFIGYAAYCVYACAVFNSEIKQ